MKKLALLFCTGCAISAGSVDGDDTSDPPDGGKTDDPSSVFSTAWTYTSPAGMQQLPQEDVAVFGSLRVGLRGFDQIATAATEEGAQLAIVPRRGTSRPLKLLAEPTNSRSLAWMLTPLGLLWHNPIVWDDGTVDAGGRLLYHVLEGGVMSATWTRPPAGTSLAVELSVAPVPVSPTVFRVGTLHVRILGGRHTVTGRVIDVTPSAGRTQILVYTDPIYSTEPVDAAGALLEPREGRVSVRSGPTAEKHVHFTSPILELDHVHALGGTPAKTVGPVLLADRAELYVGAPGSTGGWRIASLAVKIIKTGPVSMRRMRYAHVGSGVGGQTFNFYVFSPRGTVTLWPVGRVTEPYRLSLYDDPTQVVHASFPATQNDYSEDLAGGTNVMATQTSWAFDDTTLIEASTMTSKVALAHTGQEGNSVDGGWRHVANGPLSSYLVGNGTTFGAKTVPTGSYRFDPGNAVQAVYSTHAVFHQQRVWTGAWAERGQRVASLRADPSIYFGTIKDLHNTDVLAANKTLEVGQVLHVAPGPAEDPSTLYDRYAMPLRGVRGAMLDLEEGPEINAPWDLARAGDEVGVVFAN